MPIPREQTDPGHSTPCHCCCSPTSGARSRQAWPNGLGCWTPCWPISTDPSVCCPKGSCLPSWSSGIPTISGPVTGIVPRGGNWLHIYAADLARAPDGRWWLLADRTQAPSGAGYALENREIVEQVLPEAIRQLGVKRVAGVFSELREQLLSHGDEGENPLAVILTPGPFNETYFEHAYLARQLGIPLAEGTDLTVRDDTVYLKTLAGLKRVHTILRRLDDDFCDPLELRSDSTLGIPGLIGAVRANRVVSCECAGHRACSNPRHGWGFCRA